MMFRQKVDPSLFRPFGCPAYALIPKKKWQGKFGAKARKCIMLGYEGGKKAYPLLDLETRKIIFSRHVKFDETGKVPPDNLNGFETDQGDWGNILRHQQASVDIDEVSENSSDSGSDTSESPPSHSIPDNVRPVGAPDSLSASLPHDSVSLNTGVSHNSPKSSLRPVPPTPVTQIPINAPPGYRKAKIRSHTPSPVNPPADRPKRNQKSADRNGEYY